MIQFLSPAFLYALLLIAIPIIIHLFNFRKFKKVFFTNVRFLKELKQETTSKSKLKHLLVLASRILAVIFLVFAFARPIIPSGKKKVTGSSDAVSIYIDNSFTMQAIRTDGTLLEVAGKKAKEIAAAYSPSSRFQLLTADFDPVHQRLLSRDEFIDMVDQVKAGSNTRTVDEIVKRQHEALARASSANAVHYIISDFQASMAGANVTQADTSEEIVLIPVQASTAANIYIDSCWFTSPAVQINQPAELTFRIVNNSEKAAENVPVKVTIDGQAKAVATVNIAPGQPVVTSVNFTITNAGWHKGEVSITDHPVTFDDVYYFSFDVKDAVSVLALNGGEQSPYLKALFGTDDFVRFSNTLYTQVDYRLLQQQQLVIINEVPSVSTGLTEELKKYLLEGGHVIFFPDSNADLNSYNACLSQLGADVITGLNSNSDRVEKLDRNNILFSDVFQQNVKNDASIDYPTALKHFDLAKSSGSNRQVLMQLQGGGAFLSQYEIGKGSLYIFSVPLSPGFSNLAHHAVFVPALYKMALLSLKGHELAFTIGRNASVQLKGSTSLTEDNFRLVGDKDKQEMIPQQRVTSSGIDVSFNNMIPVAGHYSLMSGNKLVSALSFNYDRKESDMRMLNADQIALLMKEHNFSKFSTLDPTIPDLTKKLKQLTDGISLWKYCVLFVLVFLFAETLLLRFWKT